MKRRNFQFRLRSIAGGSAGVWLLDRVDDVGTDLFVALQL